MKVTVRKEKDKSRLNRKTWEGVTASLKRAKKKISQNEVNKLIHKLRKLSKTSASLKMNSANAVDVAVNVLRSGGVVVIPTESSYGIAVDAANAGAVARVYRLKKRSGGKFMPVIVASVAMAKKFFSLNPNALKLCKHYPAPLTLVVKQRGNKLAHNISADRTVAFRVPANKFCRDVSKKLGRPITSTSANVSGKTPVFSVVKVEKLFGGKVDLIVDGGNLKKEKSSTIVNCVAEKPVVLRRGIFVLSTS